MTQGTGFQGKAHSPPCQTLSNKAHRRKTSATPEDATARTTKILGGDTEAMQKRDFSGLSIVRVVKGPW